MGIKKESSIWGVSNVVFWQILFAIQFDNELNREQLYYATEQMIHSPTYIRE